MTPPREVRIWQCRLCGRTHEQDEARAIPPQCGHTVRERVESHPNGSFTEILVHSSHGAMDRTEGVIQGNPFQKLADERARIEDLKRVKRLPV